MQDHGGMRWTARGALGGALLVALTLGACATPPRAGADRAAARAVESKLAAGLDLYAAGDFTVAAERFAAAGDGAARLRDRELERRARIAACTAWLRARRIDAFARCSERLEPLQRRARRSDPGVNTLVALGAIAGRRAGPPLRVPNAVLAVLRDVAQEEH